MILIKNIIFQLYTNKSSKEFDVLVCLCIHVPDDDLVVVEIRRRNMSDNLLFITDWAVCWNKYCVISLLHGIWTALNLYKTFPRSFLD
jgi:hypothetical protein